MAEQHRMLALTIRDKAGLYAAYMPYLRNGGVFVPTHGRYVLGDDVFMLLTLPDEPQKFPIHGKVAWVTPHGCQGGRPQGIGVHFPQDDISRGLRNRIEVLLGGSLRSPRATHTM